MNFRSARAAFLLLLSAVAACGGHSTTPFTCSGTTCTCPPAASCDVTPDTCPGGGCTLECHTRATCNQTSACKGGACQVAGLSCTDESSCVVTVAAGGTATCSGGSICRVTCSQSCSLDCSGDASCNLLCNVDAGAGDAGSSDGGVIDASTGVIGAGSCP